MGVFAVIVAISCAYLDALCFFFSYHAHVHDSDSGVSYGVVYSYVQSRFLFLRFFCLHSYTTIDAFIEVLSV